MRGSGVSTTTRIAVLAERPAGSEVPEDAAPAEAIDGVINKQDQPKEPPVVIAANNAVDLMAPLQQPPVPPGLAPWWGGAS